MFRYSAPEGQRGGEGAQSDWLNFTNKPRRGENERELAEGWIIKYAWYSTMFHSAQMSHSGTWECYGIPVRLLCLSVSICTHIAHAYARKHLNQG